MGPGGADRLDFEALETGLRRRMLEMGAQLAARRINQDHSRTGSACASLATAGVRRTMRDARRRRSRRCWVR